MPFTLAHPAAVLPLKRWCPRFLSFSALVVGSITPDVGYCFWRYNLDSLSHRFVGSFIFCLPVGVVMMTAIYFLRKPAVNLLPARQRQVFLPLCQKSLGSPLVILISLLLGAWTHLVWDSFTHAHGWVVAHVPALQIPLASVRGHNLAVCHLLWYASSFVGVAWLCFDYERWHHARDTTAPGVSRNGIIRNSLLVGALVLPIEALHHLVQTPVGFALVGACSVLLVVSVALIIGNKQPANRPQKP